MTENFSLQENGQMFLTDSRDLYSVIGLGYFEWGLSKQYLLKTLQEKLMLQSELYSLFGYYRIWCYKIREFNLNGKCRYAIDK